MARPPEPGQSQSGASEAESCGDFDIRIGADGTWYYRNSPIGRLPLVKLFASVMRREADGSYWLVTPVERGLIVVDDAPFTAVEVDASSGSEQQRLEFRTNLDDRVTADASHPIRIETDPATGEPRPYVLVRDGLEARILRPVYYQLVELGEFRKTASGETFGVWSGGQFFTLGEMRAAG
ncbi:MAG: DUF1285 domain-containing protein [Dongiaceae bacterium]